MVAVHIVELPFHGDLAPKVTGRVEDAFRAVFLAILAGTSSIALGLSSLTR